MTPKPLTLSERVAQNLIAKRAQAVAAAHRTKRRRERRKRAETYDRMWKAHRAQGEETR